MSLSAGLPNRRHFLGGVAAVSLAGLGRRSLPAADSSPRKSLISVSLDLEMSAQYPRRDMLEWNYEKGNLDEPTKRYSVEAARIVKEQGGVVHFFCVGRVLEQPNVDWLKEIAAAGHPVGNHTYDHVNVKATKPEDAQFRFQRAPWLVQGQTAAEMIRHNIRLTNEALQRRAGIAANGFRTPGGFSNGLTDRPDLQQMLLDLGFTWVSSKYPAHATGKPKEEPPPEVYTSIVEAQREAQPFVYANGLIEIPMSPISDVTAFRSNYWTLDYFLKAIGDAVAWAIRTGGTFVFLAHPSCLVVEDPQFETIRLICRMVKEAGDKASLVGLDKIAVQVKQGTKGDSR